MNCPLFLPWLKNCAGLSPKQLPNQGFTLGGRFKRPVSMLEQYLSFPVVIGQLAWSMEHRQITIGVAIHAYFSLHVMAAMSIRRNLQYQPLETHTVIVANGSIKLLT